jgi:hypothetical protein
VQEEVGLAHFLERGPEARHQVVRKLADEADGVGEHDAMPLPEVYLAREGIERREEAVLDEDILALPDATQDGDLPALV